MSGVGVQSLQEDEEGDGQESHGHCQREEETGQGETRDEI